MNIFFHRYKNTVRRRITENVSGTCVGCLLEIAEEHTCSVDFVVILQVFDSVFNRRNSARVEVFRLRLLEALLDECVEDRNVVRELVVGYQESRPELNVDKENLPPINDGSL